MNSAKYFRSKKEILSNNGVKRVHDSGSLIKAEVAKIDKSLTLDKESLAKVFKY